MRTFVAVMQREILQRKQILMTAACLALAPFLARYLPNVAASDRPEVTMIVGMIVLCAYGIATPVALGASMIGRDLSEKRLGFYFSRPISASALFSGKFAGSLLIVVAAVAMILLPLLLFEPEVRKSQGGWESSLFFAAPICLLLVANVIGSIVRSRSKISALDLVLATLAGFSMYSLVRRFLFSGAENGAIAMAIVFALALVAGLAAASIAHVAHGRTDPKRGHAALSVTLWAVVGTTLAALLAYTFWFFASGPGDLVRVDHAYALPSGPRVVVAGPVRGRLGFWQLFVVDPSAKPVRLEGVDGQLSFSRDGQRVAWVQPESIKVRKGELRMLDLGRNDPRSRPTAIFAAVRDKLVLSPNGERAAIFAGEETLTVYELGSGQALFSARIPRAKTDRSRMMFVTGDLLRVVVYGELTRDAQAVSLFEVDVPGRRLVRKASATVAWKGALLVSASPAGDRLLLRGGGDHPLAVIDFGSGKRLDFPGSPGSKGLPALLRDGRIVIPRVANGAASLELRTKEGALERVIPLGPFGRVSIGWEVAAGKLLATVHRSSEGTPEPAGWTALLVDLEKGEIVGRESGLRTLGSISSRWFEDDLLDGPVVGSPGAMTFLDAGNSVVRWNPLTGEKTVVFKLK